MTNMTIEFLHHHKSQERHHGISALPERRSKSHELHMILPLLNQQHARHLTRKFAINGFIELLHGNTAMHKLVAMDMSFGAEIALNVLTSLGELASLWRTRATRYATSYSQCHNLAELSSFPTDLKKHARYTSAFHSGSCSVPISRRLPTRWSSHVQTA